MIKSQSSFRVDVVFDVYNITSTKNAESRVEPVDEAHMMLTWSTKYSWSQNITMVKIY